MKHIYIFCMQSSGVVYGIGTYIQQLTETLKDRKDVSLNVVIRHSDETEFTIKETDGIRTFYLSRINKQYNPKFDDLYNRNLCFLLRPYIRLGLSDQLIFHLNYYEEGSCIPCFRKAFPDCKIIFTIHCQRWCFFLNGNTTYFKKLIRERKEDLHDTEKFILTSYETEKKVLQSVDLIICLAAYTENILIEDYQILPEKIVTIYNGLKDEGKILLKNERNELRRKMSFPENELIILFVGRLDQIKGLDILIRAFKVVLRTYAHARLIVVGDGEFNLYLKECKGLWDRITFTGRLDRQSVYDFYQIADVGVIPSFHEQCSYVAIEMMMFGLPIVVSTSTGLSEMVNADLEPYKVQVLEIEKSATILPEELATKLMTILENRISAISIRKNYEERFSIQTMGRKYNAMIEQFK